MEMYHFSKGVEIFGKFAIDVKEGDLSFGSHAIK